MPDASGIGGRTREDKVMSTVDEAVNGSVKSAVAPTSQSAPVQAPIKAHPSSYAPSDNSSAVVSHVYGSPIEGNAPSK